jgi:hypothetical protein
MFDQTINISGLLHVEKGLGHVDKYICFSKSNPGSSRACHRADDHLGNRRNDWFRLDADRPRYRASRFEATRWTLEIFHLPVPCFSRSVHFLMLFI